MEEKHNKERNTSSNNFVFKSVADKVKRRERERGRERELEREEGRKAE